MSHMVIDQQNLVMGGIYREEEWQISGLINRIHGIYWDFLLLLVLFCETQFFNLDCKLENKDWAVPHLSSPLILTQYWAIRHTVDSSLERVKSTPSVALRGNLREQNQDLLVMIFVVDFYTHFKWYRRCHKRRKCNQDLRAKEICPR
jgi:extradiol dioxygenase family protein